MAYTKNQRVSKKMSNMCHTMQIMRLGSKIICASILIKWALCVISQQTRARLLLIFTTLSSNMRAQNINMCAHYSGACTSLRFMAYAMCLLLGVNGHVPRQRKLHIHQDTHTSYRGGGSSSSTLFDVTHNSPECAAGGMCKQILCGTNTRRRECAIRTMRFSW
jgi:hypothetical protein